MCLDWFHVRKRTHDNVLNNLFYRTEYSVLSVKQRQKAAMENNFL